MNHPTTPRPLARPTAAARRSGMFAPVPLAGTSRRRVGARRGLTWRWRLALGLAALMAPGGGPAQAQAPASPTAPAAGTAPGTLTVSAGAPDFDAVAAYRLARTPLTATVSVPTVAAVAAATAPAPTDPGATPPTTTVPPPDAAATAPGVVSQLSPDPLTDLFDPVGVPLSAGAQAAPAVSVSVDFGFPSAGQLVFVQPFSGGTVDGLGGGHFVTLDATGACTFRFQPPARSGRYQVSLRFDNVESGLRFLVYDPAAKGSDRKPAALGAGS